jgi:hypothetical protein
MSTVVVTGCESSGTSLVTRILRSAGAWVQHRSATYDGDWDDLPALASQADAVVVVFRDPVVTMRSQIGQGLDEREALEKLRRGYRELAAVMGQLRTVPIYCITYEQLVLNPDSIRPLLALMGLDAGAAIEPVRNENSKYALTGATE